MSAKSQTVSRVRRRTGPCGCCGDMVLSFDMADGSVLRLRMTREQRAEVVDLFRLRWPYRSAGKCPECFQSESAPGNPQSDGSTPEEGQNTAPMQRSSNAAAGL